MMKDFKYSISILLYLTTLSVFGSTNKEKGLDSIYYQGSGQKYSMKSPHFPESTVSIYNAKVETNNLWVEFYIESGVGIIQTGLWQQFEFKNGNSGLELKAGYIMSKEMSMPEELPSNHLKGSDSLKMSQFLFKDENEIKQYLKGTEEVSVVAGTVDCQHYQMSGDGQTIDFWLSTDSKPLTMVKLVSSGSKKVHDYTMELLTLVKNVKAKIDPSKSRPLSENMRKTLEETPLN